MTRESRLILVLLILAAVGISGLMLVANQYRKALAGAGPPQAFAAEDAKSVAARHVEGFLAARAAARADVSNYRDAMSQAFAAYRMTHDDYVAVRTAWRRYRAGMPIDDAALTAAFQARKPALETEASSANEALDDGFK